MRLRAEGDMIFGWPLIAAVLLASVHLFSDSLRVLGGSPVTAEMVRFKVDYTLWLNLGFLLVGQALFYFTFIFVA